MDGMIHPDGTKTTIAAAVLPGSLVVLPIVGERFAVAHIRNADPRPGIITWIDPQGETAMVKASTDVEYIALIKPREEYNR